MSNTKNLEIAIKKCWDDKKDNIFNIETEVL